MLNRRWFQIYDNAMIAAGLNDDPRPMISRLNELLARALEKHWRLVSLQMPSEASAAPGRADRGQFRRTVQTTVDEICCCTNQNENTASPSGCSVWDVSSVLKWTTWFIFDGLAFRSCLVYESQFWSFSVLFWHLNLQTFHKLLLRLGMVPSVAK